MKDGQNTPIKLEFRLKNKDNRQKAGLKPCFGRWSGQIGTNRLFWVVGRDVGFRSPNRDCPDENGTVGKYVILFFVLPPFFLKTKIKEDLLALAQFLNVTLRAAENDQSTAVMSLSLHHAQAQDLYEEKRSHESLAEKRGKTRVKLELECAAAWRGGSHYG